MTPPELLADARATLRQLPGSPLREEFDQFLTANPTALDRSCDSGHLTASALVVDPDGRALLMLHRKVGRWLQMGGHLETGDRTLRGAAAREASEESGIEGLELTAQPVNLDRHAVRCDGRELDHLDVQYVALAPGGARAVGNDESLGLRWFDLADVPSEDVAVVRLVAAARRILG